MNVHEPTHAQNPDTSPTSETVDDKVQRVARVVLDGALEHGVTWARYGLGLGRQALVTQARTLELLASTLGKIADSLTTSPGPKNDDEPKAHETRAA